MTKKEMKDLLSVYSQIRTAVLGGRREAVIRKYRRKHKYIIPNWAAAVEKSISAMMQTEDKLICEIMKQLYFSGKRNREVIAELPVEDNCYYNLKKCIEEKIYELCISYGVVSEEDILRNKI